MKNQIEKFRDQAINSASYFDAVSKIFADAEAKHGPGFDREWHAMQIVVAAAYLAFRYGREYYATDEANELRHNIFCSIDSVHQLLGYQIPYWGHPMFDD